ncbi:unnamed protein product, partial [marine sediment metagenome]
MTAALRADVVYASAVLEIKNLKTYFFLKSGSVRAVDGVDLDIYRNTMLGLVGESGCGKSVTSLSIMRLIQSPPGKIVEGQILLHSNGNSNTVDLASLDPKGQELLDNFGSAIIMVTHNLGVISQMADFVAVMYLGKIVEYA